MGLFWANEGRARGTKRGTKGGERGWRMEGGQNETGNQGVNRESTNLVDKRQVYQAAVAVENTVTSGYIVEKGREGEREKRAP